MIIDEQQNNAVPISSISKTTTIQKIINSVKITSPYFKKAISDVNILRPINENKYTQVFVQQLNTQLRKANYTFIAGVQYSELFYNVKGIPDLYFYNSEEGTTNTALFVIEAKILPTPLPLKREKEYVIGENFKTSGEKDCNGGIERFKIEKHGFSLSESGLIAFVEKNNFVDWSIKINSWIEDLSKSDSNWFPEETLKFSENDNNDYAQLISIVKINLTKEIKLHHFWITV
jgi:hypothetical protein